MRSRIGSSIAQYAIIILLVGIVLIPALLVLGKNIYSNFENFRNNLAGGESASANQEVVVTPPDSDSNNTGSSDTSSSSSVKKVCSSGVCKLDFGNIVLEGVPDDFADFVESAGTSGGTDTLASLIDQLVAQMEDSVSPENLQDVKDLANMGHLIADYEKHIEDYSKQCLSDADPGLCVGKFLYHGEATYTAPSNYTNLFPDLNLDFENPGKVLEIGGSMKNYIDDKEEFDSVKNTELATAFVEKFQAIKDNPVYTDEQKAVIQELYWQIGAMATEMDNIVWSSGSSNYDSDTYIDPISLESTTYNVTGFKPENIINPNYSHITDIDSALICATGEQKDSGKQCH